MADKTADKDVDVDLEAPVVVPEVEVVAAETTPQKRAIEPEEGLEELKRKLAESDERERAERARATAAEKRAHTAETREVTAKNEVQDTNLHLINTALETIKASTESLRQNYAAAAASGEWDHAAELQDLMATNAAKRLQLEQGKKALEGAPKARPPAEVISDPVEALASQLTPRSAAWVRAHPQCATDQRLYQKMIAAHNLALADGLTPDTDDYFSSIEDTLKIRSRTAAEVDDDPTAGAAQVTQRRAAPPAAPVTRGGNGTGSPTVVRLTAAEREMAEMMGMSEKDYAKNKVALIRDGKMN